MENSGKSEAGSYEIRCAVAGRDYEGVNTISVQEYRVPLFSVVVEATGPEVGTTAHARSPLHIFTVRQTSARASIGRRRGQHRLSMVPKRRGRFESVSTLSPKSDRGSTLTAKS